jgi:hypothetical protein
MRKEIPSWKQHIWKNRKNSTLKYVGLLALFSFPALLEPFSWHVMFMGFKTECTHTRSFFIFFFG